MTADNKNKFSKKWPLLGLALGAAGIGAAWIFSAASNPPEPTVGKVTRDIFYVPGSKNPSQSLDLCIPENALSPTPLIVYIHGGGWLNGDKRPSIAPLVVPQGYACASLNYRLTSEAIFPAQIHDCKAAIRWLRAYAGENNIDPNRIGVWGVSAGAHLASLLGTSGDVKELEGTEGNLETKSNVQAVVDWCGPSDLISVLSQAKPDNEAKLSSPDGVLARLLGGLPTAKPEIAAQASPTTYISKEDAPFFIMHGDVDKLVQSNKAKS